MAVFRIEKTKDYTIMSNNHLKEKGMSLKAKGLLSIMLSLPDDWDYSIAGLVSICKENESAINSTLGELKEFGYLKVDKFMPNQTESGRIEYLYTVYEKPFTEKPNTVKQEGKKQDLENLGVEIQCLENQGQLNTNKQLKKNKELNNIKEEAKTINDILDTIEEPTLIEPLKEFIKMRKAIKKPMTTRAFELILNKLNKLAVDTPTQIKILEQSILNGWQDVYGLKGNKEIKKDYDDFDERMRIKAQQLGGVYNG